MQTYTKAERHRKHIEEEYLKEQVLKRERGAMIVSSGNYLTKRLPLNFYSMTAEMLTTYVGCNISEKYENWDAADVLDEIREGAGAILTYLEEYS